MATICLDTDIIVDLLRGKESLSDFLSLVPLGINTTIITLMELYYGSFKSNRPADIHLIDSLNNDLNIVKLKENDARLAGKIMAALEKKGKKLDFRDVTIAAICIDNEMSLVTRNRKHFRLMEEFGLKLLDW